MLIELDKCGVLESGQLKPFGKPASARKYLKRPHDVLSHAFQVALNMSQND